MESPWDSFALAFNGIDIFLSSSLYLQLVPIYFASARTRSSAILCDQHHTKAGFTIHHASVSLGSLLKRKRFDHGPHILQDAERQRVLSVDGAARQAAINRAPADPLNANQIARAQASVTQCVVSRYASAEERGGFRGRELIRNGSERSCFGNHHLGITPVGSDS